ncbi:MULTISPECIES: efflux RND transporter permease subunit [Rhizobium/Agrobacterium group]|uniref:Efflux pump membrane transporter n=1 Tax=Agrobacterium tomkonis CFBP 6623 TaxID=1183432 RepID=A0A1S7S4K0_9HYPH|nr:MULTISPECIES: efflux RND transporter permease subunit [Rhizobium/Agrobacterium group]MCA2376327.1 multidrug efflux RND transporter permease subunit [Agrobacterium tomkonis RTP8]KRA55192.1 acriflavine resistance protein B [Rhizobium sp. Root651]MCZ7451699.1 efflux RND transporter permease subunit [Rhizobium rhizogenes]QCL90760.1 multidrug efflux RND transporter permease subunit [Agrobacterium tumefaciens]TKT57892.1 multidrug efflux RND transporter permease subunit [Agrobacterium sp. LC34]
MARFFIDRPIFAWVVAIFIMLAGLLAIPMLPIAQYPNVAPPQISVGTTYPGASPEDIYQSVTRPIEEELNGVPGLIYFESTSESSGRISINVTFEPGTNIGEAQVEVQNRIARVEPRLPQAVTQQGLRVEQAGTSFLMMVALTSVDGNTDAIGLGDYLSRNVVGELRRVPGVGSAQLFATQRSMRIWMDPDKMLGLSLTSSDVIGAIQAQNSQVAAGRIGASPNPVGQQISATVNVQGQLTSPEEFGSIVLRANPDGSSVRLRDVARVEVGGESYTFSSRLNGKPSAAIGVQLSPTGNALQTSEGVRATMEELSRYFPAGIEYEIPYDTSPFVKISIQKVINTLVEAIILVFVVMFVFLQNIRYTIIPTLVVPVALLGTCAIMYISGFSINVLTMFAMVLAIGILVDDAIVVVENVERIMAEEHLSPKEATRKAMGQISGAIIGITLVLTAVFVPMAFFPGAVGIIYQQFSLTMVVSILFSGFLALSLTPALCASFLKPIKAGHHEKKGFFGWFNRGFDKASHKYSSSVGSIIKRSGRFMVIYAALLAGLGWAYMQLPSSFLPNEDQGYLIVDIQAPAEASSERTLQSIQEIEKIFLAEPAVDRVIAVSGFSFSGSGQNAGLAFATLKDWSERGPEDSASAIAQRINGKLWGLPGSMSFTLSPPPIQGLGNSSGFTFRLQDRGGAGQTALSAAGAQLMAAAQKSPILAGLRVEGMPDSPQVNLIIDREKANTFGVTFSDINATISANMGSSYVNDFPNAGRMQRVTVQAEQGQRMKTEDLLNLNVRNANGGMVPVSSFATVEWVRGPSQVVGYNGYPAIRIGGQSAPGYSSGDAIAEMERLAGELPNGFGFEWTGQSLQEIQSGSQAPALIGLSVLFVFLLLAALYESWSIPLSVMLVVPLGVIGSVAAVMLRGMPNDVYFLVGLVAIIGLSAKNAILIIEFAKDLRAEGKSTYDATVEAAHLRFRPILMTSLAFSLGVLPMAIASGASAASQNAIGTGVLGGMISATILAIFFVPVFFVFVMKFFGDRKKDDKIAADAVSPAE